MRANFTQLYLHYVWATWDRLPLITPDIQKLVYAVIIKECEQLKCTVIAVGGIEDHIHLLTGFPTTISVSEVIKQIKGSSSHFINHEIKPADFFKWQGSYGAFTVSHDAIDNVAHYIRNQAIHHQQKSIISAWELNLPAGVKGD
ncbi:MULTISPECIES: IS200/IS605 family transposase [Nostoc]|uniref:IS200/IS605 family transposase n=1 Tax=Nostoc paludosum FACHB-159 TaxID=2692908 RepID=A0ABR8K4T0_9NOSO|nr:MULTISPECIES: IS200/IS605 family transposase [Nostoc]MBD2677731.1 IS200/IS605 family transposase [Nostoc sp. FACHB-857]MBD2733779.1 IS200/IS605 family transposase [Nostoc paludosum FACHB-159]